jgi:putative ATPase
MIYAGEDPRFIFRRMLIFAGEDVGLADPNAIRVVTACAEAYDRVGLPEGRFHLAEAVLYLATAPKSNSTLAFFDALTLVEQEQEGEVPTHLKDSSRDKEGFGHGQGYLYPHAFREHWIAQQYLPDALQGRTFYQPSDQGHERGIRDQVARRREAQLAAMVEGESQLEVLTYTVGDRAHDRWLQRTISNAGERLGRVRDRVLDAARLQRHHVVLDLNAGSGLLTWEILRRTPEGGTWALAQNREAGEGLRQQVEQLPDLERPVVIVGTPEELPDLLALRDEAGLRFDAMVGRNVLARVSDKAEVLRLLLPLLRPGGRLGLAETLLRHAQRLYDLVDLAPLDDDLRRRVLEAEEQIYAKPDDPLVGWDVADLRRAMEAAGFEELSVEDQVQETEILVSKATLERWFATDVDAGRPSYAQHLLASLSRDGITPDELALIRATYESQLANQTIPWRTRLVYVVGRAPQSVT